MSALIIHGAIAAFYSYLSGSPFVYMNLFGFTTTQFGWIYGANAVGLVMASQINRILLRIRGSFQILLMVVSAQFCLTVALLVCSFVGPGSRLGIVGLVFCFIFCQGFINPNGMALALQPFARKAGIAVAFMGSMQMLAGALASGLVSYLYDGTARPMIWVMLGSTAIGLTILATRATSKGSETLSEG